MFQNILLDKQDGIATITIDRPEVRNALDTKTREEILSAVEDVAQDDDIKVVIFTGAGEKAFIAGADITVFKELNPPGILNFSYRLGNMGLFQKIRQLDKPTIAAVNGAAVGYGCDTALMCDIRVASEYARFG